eukprot:scaffold3146_cov245-Pinguiococcus_pyrenoidosus.AAC.4
MMRKLRCQVGPWVGACYGSTEEEVNRSGVRLAVTWGVPGTFGEYVYRRGQKQWNKLINLHIFDLTEGSSNSILVSADRLRQAAGRVDVEDDHQANPPSDHLLKTLAVRESTSPKTKFRMKRPIAPMARDSFEWPQLSAFKRRKAAPLSQLFPPKALAMPRA